MWCELVILLLYPACGFSSCRSLECPYARTREYNRVKLTVSDEWIDTGASMAAVTRMLESCGVEVVGIGTLQLTEGRADVADDLYKRYDVFAANRE